FCSSNVPQGCSGTVWLKSLLMAYPGAAHSAAASKKEKQKTVARKLGRDIAFYPLELQFAEPRTPNENRWRALHSCSVQLNIKLDRRNHFTLFSFDPGRSPSPALHRIDGGIGKDGLAF